MKNGAGLGFAIMLFAIGAMVGALFYTPYIPTPNNPPWQAVVPISIFATLMFTGIAMILGSDIDNPDPNDRIIFWRSADDCKETKQE